MRRPSAKQLVHTLAFDFPVILDLSKPSVTLHKNGKYLLFKPNDLAAADILRELKIRMECNKMHLTSFFGFVEEETVEMPVANGVVKTHRHKQVSGWGRVELWKHLGGDVNKHPLCDMLRSYGVEVGTSSTLKGYILKEHRRRVLEEFPYPASPIVKDDVSLFGRCCPGTTLVCVKNFAPAGAAAALFKKGSRYLVASTGESDGCDQIQICTEAITHNAKLNLVGKGKLHSWTEFNPAMEEWFDDTETMDFGKTIDQVYPDRVKQMEDRLAKLSYMQKAVEAGDRLPLFEHVRKDAVLEALKRGVINCKLMRMGKTSEAITICELWGSQKIGIVGTRNVRLAWRKEFRRLGMKNFVFVNKIEDLDKEGKYYLFTLDWLKDYTDPSRGSRKNFENYLRASERKVRRTVKWSCKPEEITVYQHNTCPHCQSPLERPLFSEEGVTTKVGWTTDKGYLCRNQGCSWTTDNRCKPGHKLVHDSLSHRGAAWAAEDDRVITHKPGAYVDEALARHARCSGEHIKGRMCLECGAVDGTWIPPRYRRVKDLYSAVVGDEIHNAKEYNTQNARAMYSFRSRRRIAMTGTLLSNSPLDAYWPLHWAVARPCPQFPWQGAEGKKEFENRFCDFVYLEKPTGEIDEETGVEITKTIRKRTPFLINPPDWWRTMQPKIVRRNYSDPLFQQSLLEAGMKLPRVSIKRTIVPMAAAQARLMLAALRDFRVQFEQMVEEAEAKGNEVNKALVIAKMSALRTIATSPERLNQKFGYEVYNGPPGGGKMRQIVNLVADSVAQGKKVFILSDFIEMQIQVEKALHAYNPIRMPSSWGDEKRVEAMELFAHDPERHVWVSGTRSVREAIDVSCADVTICCDLLWSPAWQCQAWSRTMAPTERDRDCEVYLMLSQNSLDEYIYTVFYSKMVGAEQALDRKVMNRRALDFDVKFFAQRVLEEEEALSLQIRDDFGDTEMVYMPELELAEERAS